MRGEGCGSRMLLKSQYLEACWFVEDLSPSRTCIFCSTDVRTILLQLYSSIEIILIIDVGYNLEQ
jgi:hypothetical protein